MWMKCLTDESLNGIKPIAEYPNYILQNYWKLGEKKVRNQIGSRGKNLEM